MSTSKVFRSREEIPNSLACLPACHALLLLLALPLLAHAWQGTAPPAAACRTAGQVSGWDLVDHTLTLKSDSGHYSDFHYDGATTFTSGSAIFRPDNFGIVEGLNIDDRLCVEAFRGGSQEIASRVRVTSRPEIDARDRQELIRWQGESLFGTVKALDPANHRITVKVTASSDVSVDAAGPVEFWTLPTAADDPSDAVRGGWESLATGDAIYVRGERATGMPARRARMIISGGFRSFTGSVESMEPLTSSLRLRDFRSGRIRTVHFNFTTMYVVGKNTVPGDQDRRLYPATIGDLKVGDSVLVMGRENDQTAGIDLFLLITGFSPGGVLRPSAAQSSDWIFQAIGFGGTRP